MAEWCPWISRSATFLHWPNAGANETLNTQVKTTKRVTPGVSRRIIIRLTFNKPQTLIRNVSSTAAPTSLHLAAFSSPIKS